MLRYRKKLEAIRDPKTWIARIAWRVAVDRSKKRAEISLSEKQTAEAIRQLRSQLASAEESTSGSELAGLLSSMITALPEPLRDALRLSTINELSPREIANVLETTEASVRSRLFRARQKLRDKLAHWKGNMESHDRDRLDEWLGDELQRYGAVEPRAGLEGRILANLAVHEKSARRRGRAWAFLSATAAAASLVILLLVGWQMRQKGIVNPSAKIPAVANKSAGGQQSATRSHAIPAAVPRAARKRPHPLNAGVRPEPKLDQFPSQRPLSEQEQLLAEYVAQFPNEARLIAEQQAETEREMEQLYAENSRRRSQQER